MPTDIDLVNLSAAIYQGTSSWDYIDTGTDDGVYWAIKNLDDCQVVVFRGSITPLDWWRDLRSLPIETNNIGTVHEGFHAGMEHMWADLKPMITKPVVITGHSLGAARADILCGLMVADKTPPARLVVFGEPRPGLADFANIISKVSRASYRNGNNSGHDRVWDVPLRLFGKLDFIHPTRPTIVYKEPSGDLFQKYGLFALHHITLYQAAVAAHLKEIIA